MNLPYDQQVLRGRVTGAGRGIVAALGETGATVICTGRTSSVRRQLTGVEYLSYRAFASAT